MKKLSETLTELGISFTFPIEFKDANGCMTYYEGRDGSWYRWDHDADGNVTYHKNSDGFWCRYDHDADGNVTYYEESDDFWYRCEYDTKGNKTYFADSRGYTGGTPRSANKT